MLTTIHQDRSPNGSDNGVAAVIVSYNVGVATVVDQGKGSICSCTDFILIGEKGMRKNINIHKHQKSNKSSVLG